MPLQHQLRGACPGVPELHAPILRPGHNPLVVRRERDREHEVLVALERLDAPAALGRVGRGHDAAGRVELPHLDRLVETATDEVLAVRGECDRVDAILVALLTFEPLQDEALVEVPNPDALVERPSRYVLRIGGDGHRRDTVLDRQCQDVGACLDVPQADGAITAAGCDRTAVAREVERVDVLLVAGEGVANLLLVNVPDLHGLVSECIRVRKGVEPPTLISLSSAPVARYRPSGLKQTLRI